MRVLFIVCTIIIILQILDVSITGVSAVRSNIGENGKTVKRLPKKKPQLKVAPNASKSKNTLETEPIDDETNKETLSETTSLENENSQELKTPVQRARKNVVKTTKEETNKLQVGFFNNLAKLVSTGSNAIFDKGNNVKGHAKNLYMLGKEGLGMNASLGNAATNGIIKSMRKGKEIGGVSKKQVSDIVDHSTDLTKNVIKVGGNAITTPISIATDTVALTNGIIGVPKKLSRSITKTVLPFLGENDSKEKPKKEEEELEKGLEDEEEKEEGLEDEEDEEEEEVEKIKKKPIVSTPIKTAPNKQKAVPKREKPN